MARFESAGTTRSPCRPCAATGDARAASQTIGGGARVEVLDGLDHWWMAQDDGRRGATALIGFWSSLSDAKP